MISAPSIPSKNSESVPLFIIEHHTIPHLQEAPSASCQPIAAATPTPAQCWTVSAWGTELLRFRIITVVTSTHLYDQAVTSSICNDMDIILQDKDIHGMEWYNGTIHYHIHKYNANANESHKMQTFDSFDCD